MADKTRDEWDAELIWAQQRAADNDLRARIAEDKVGELTAELANETARCNELEAANERLRWNVEVFRIDSLNKRAELNVLQAVVDAAIAWVEVRDYAKFDVPCTSRALMDAVRAYKEDQ